MGIGLFFGVVLLAAGDAHVRPFPAASATPTPRATVTAAPGATPLRAMTADEAAAAAAAAAATPTPAASPLDAQVAAKRPALLGSDHAAATAAIEEISLLGGHDAFAAICDFLAHWKGDKEMERHGLSALDRVPIEPSALARVLRDDPDPAHRAWAAWTAGEHEISAVGDDLLKALRDDSAEVRMRAAASLAVIGDQRAMDPLMHILVHDPDPDTRQKASDAIAVLSAPRPTKPSIDLALAKLKSPDPFTRLAGAQEIGKARDKAAVGPLLALLKTERDVDVRREGVIALASLGDEIAVPTLIEIARDDTLQVRQYAIAALATLNDERAVAPLTAMTRDAEPSIRKYALRALGFLRRDRVLAAMVARLSDPVPDVRSEAIQGMAKLGDASAAGAIAEHIPKETDSSIRQFECATLGNLGAVGNHEQERVLVKALEDDDPGVRSAAVGALAKIGTKEGAGRPLDRLIDRESKKKNGERDVALLRLAEQAAERVKARDHSGAGN